MGVLSCRASGGCTSSSPSLLLWERFTGSEQLQDRTNKQARKQNEKPSSLNDAHLLCTLCLGEACTLKQLEE